MARRLGKGAGERSYAAYRKKLSEAAAHHRRSDAVRHWVFVATCSGSVRLGREIGLPLACIDVSPDPLVAVRGMSEARHGALVPSASRPFSAEPGWDDWGVVRLVPEMAGAIRLTDGVHLLDGALALSTDRCVPASDIRLGLTGVLRHLRFHEVAGSGEAVRARHGAGGPPVVTPRYTSVRAFGEEAGRRVDNLYAFDAWKGLGALAFSVETAALQARERIVVDV